MEERADDRAIQRRRSLTLEVDFLFLPEHGACFLHFGCQRPLNVQRSSGVFLPIVCSGLRGKRVSLALLTITLDGSGDILNEGLASSEVLDDVDNSSQHAK
jgi:hypothetical protein